MTAGGAAASPSTGGVDPLLDAIRPTQHRSVMSLLAAAGHDVAPWASGKGGVAKASSNPAYCYEWAYEAVGRPTVLNVWHEQVNRDGDTLVLEGNLREVASDLERLGTSSNGAQARRARAFDAAVRRAAVATTAIRLILLSGNRMQGLDDETSSVKARALDPRPWLVRSYDAANGAFTLVRHAVPTPVVDQFDLVQPSPAESVPTREVRAMVRARSATVRHAALTRAAGLCEWCALPGFQTVSGALYLETHHVMPLAEGGPDTESNVVALCATHHREAHHGAKRDEMRAALRRLAIMKTTAAPLLGDQ